MTTQRLKVMLDTGAAYDIRVGSGLLAKLGTHLAELRPTQAEQLAPAAPSAPADQPDSSAQSPQPTQPDQSAQRAQRVVIITDENVGPLYLAQVRETLQAAGFEVFDLTVPAGETSKSLEVASELYDALGLLNIGRDGVLVALGGGVVGDLAGFVASTWLRGVACVQLPTSLLAMVDSSVGGKTALNISAGKNLVGTFRQPLYVAADLNTLATLPDAEWDNGLAEIAKSAIIDGGEFYAWLRENAAALAARSARSARANFANFAALRAHDTQDSMADSIQQAIVRAVSFKAGVVAKDETETGLRECLNYGHTFAHALEMASGFALPHGRAVAEGIRFASHLAVEAIGAPAAFADQQEKLLNALGLAPLARTCESEVLNALTADSLFDRMYADKKVRGGQLRFVLASAPGEWQTVTVDPDLVKIYLIYWEQAREQMQEQA
ncbi:MAG: 3-dehydroquinate synthase [Coriobacteriales bacterium]|jgi:3-dehydroquinate synthase|nr:3-dehydroquinate synthase [Coriobacteriales bacterium]